MTQDDGTRDARAMVAQSSMADALVDKLRAQTAVEVAQGKVITQMLQQSGPAWLKDANPAQTLAFARVCIGFGLNPLAGEAYLIHGGFYVGIQGRRKAAVRVGGFEGESAPRLLTPEEREIYGVHEGDIGRIIEVWRNGLRLPAVGCGIVRKGEIENARSGRKGPDGLPFHPLGRDPEGMAAKRAATAAYKRGFPDLDLPTADADSSMRGRIIDAETGEVLGEDTRPELTTPPREGVAVNAGSGPIDADFEPEPDQATDRAAEAERVAAEYARLRAAAVAAFGQGDPPTNEQIDSFQTGGLDWPDAEAIAAAVWAFPDMDLPLPAVVSRVHSDRAMAGQPFTAEAINEADTQRMAEEAVAAADQPKFETPEPTQPAKRAAGKAQERMV